MFKHTIQNNTFFIKNQFGFKVDLSNHIVETTHPVKVSKTIKK
jgi:hypothetical protein